MTKRIYSKRKIRIAPISGPREKEQIAQNKNLYKSIRHLLWAYHYRAPILEDGDELEGYILKVLKEPFATPDLKESKPLGSSSILIACAIPELTHRIYMDIHSAIEWSMHVLFIEPRRGPQDPSSLYRDLVSKYSIGDVNTDRTPVRMTQARPHGEGRIKSVIDPLAFVLREVTTPKSGSPPEGPKEA